MVIKPFVEHCAMHCELSCARELTITTKGPASGIGQQSADSNACAFSSVIFLGLTISTLFSVLAEAKGDERLDVSAALSERLRALKVSSSEYAKKRKVATRDVGVEPSSSGWSRGLPGVKLHCKRDETGFKGRSGCARFVHFSHHAHRWVESVHFRGGRVWLG